MSINERIKEIRTDAGLTRGQFGERIGLKQTQAGYIEKEGSAVSTRVIQLICSNFHVSEAWLLYGTEPKYVANEDMILQQLAKEFTLTPAHEVLVRQLLKMPPEVVDAIADYTVQISDALLARRQEEARLREEQKKQEELDRIAAITKTAMVADSDKPETLSDDEWELVKMRRIEKTQISDSSSSTDPMPKEKEA